ncbi:MAG: hypothetical protein V4612_06850 [Pseudomonadota bacterium]
MTRPDQTASQASEQKAPDSIAEFLPTYFADNFYISPSQSNEMVLKSLELDRERTPPLADELRSELASRIFVRATNAATSLIKEKIGSDNDVEAPLLLQVLLLMTDEEEADIESVRFSELKQDVVFYSALDALRKYHLNFSIFFIEEIQKELKELTLQGQNIFEIDPNQFLVDSLNLRPLADKKIKEVLEKLGIKDEDFSILNLLDSKKDEKTGAAIYSWKPKEEIAQFFANKLMAKYPALKRYQPEQERMESIFQYRDLEVDLPSILYITHLLELDDVDQNLIGLQFLNIFEQPFRYSQSLVTEVFNCMLLNQSKTCQTVQDFLDQSNQFLEGLQTKFPKQKAIRETCEYLRGSLIIRWALLSDDLLSVEDGKDFVKNFLKNDPHLGLKLIRKSYHGKTLLSMLIDCGNLEAIKEMLAFYPSDEDKITLLSAPFGSGGDYKGRIYKGYPALAVLLDNLDLARLMLRSLSNDNSRAWFCRIHIIDIIKNPKFFECALKSFDSDESRMEFLSENSRLIWGESIYQKNPETTDIIPKSSDSDESEIPKSSDSDESEMRFFSENGKLILGKFIYQENLEMTKIILESFDSDKSRMKLLSSVVDGEATLLKIIMRGSDLLRAITTVLSSCGESNKLEILSASDQKGLTLLERFIKDNNLDGVKAILDNCGSENKMNLLAKRNQLQRTILDQALVDKDCNLINIVVDNCGIANENRTRILSYVLPTELPKFVGDQEFKTIGSFYKLGVKIPGLEKNEECRRSVIQTMIEGLDGLEAVDQEFCLGKIFELAKNQDLKVDTIQQSLNAYASSESTPEHLKQRVDDKIKPSPSLFRRARDGLQSRRSRVVDSTQNPDLAISSPGQGRS